MTEAPTNLVGEFDLVPVDEPPCPREEMLLKQLEELRRCYERTAQPILDQLARIRAVKPRRFVIVPRSKPERDVA